MLPFWQIIYLEKQNNHLFPSQTENVLSWAIIQFLDRTDSLQVESFCFTTRIRVNRDRDLCDRTFVRYRFTESQTLATNFSIDQAYGLNRFLVNRIDNNIVDRESVAHACCVSMPRNRKHTAQFEMDLRIEIKERKA